MAKLLAASLSRTLFSGVVKIFHNGTLPIFPVPRLAIEEIVVDVPELRLLRLLPECFIGRPYIELQTPYRLNRINKVDSSVGGSDLKPPYTEAERDAHARVAMSWKYKARHYIEAENFEWIIFLDADCLALRNIDHLFGVHAREHSRAQSDTDNNGGLFTYTNADILYQIEQGRSSAMGMFSAYLGGVSESRGQANSSVLGRNLGKIKHTGAPKKTIANLPFGINSGTWAVRGESYQSVMEAWEFIEANPPNHPTQWTEQGAWNRLISECVFSETQDSRFANELRGLTQYCAKQFESSEIQFPLHLNKDWRQYKSAAILHAIGATPLEKLEFLYGVFMQRHYFDPALTLFSILET